MFLFVASLPSTKLCLLIVLENPSLTLAIDSHAMISLLCHFLRYFTSYDILYNYMYIITLFYNMAGGFANDDFQNKSTAQRVI